LSNLLRQWFAQPWLLWLFAALPVLFVLAVVAKRGRRRALALLGAGLAFEGLVGRRRGLRRMLRSLFYLSGVGLLILGTAGPQWGRDWNQSVAQDRDLVVVLDLSRSMLAEKPSRLELAQKALLDLCEAVRQEGKHRLGLVIFAGHAKLACPLTHDYDHFRETVSSFDRDHLDPALWPEDDAPSGTRIGEALALAVDALGPEEARGVQDILLLSDGDDPANDEEWRKVGIASARLKKVPVHTVGVGTPNKQKPIPLEDEFYYHDGEKVWTKLEEKPLQEIARLTGGVYVPMYARAYPLGELFLDQLTTGAVREQGDDTLPVYEQRYAWFLGPAFGLLLLTMVLGDGSRRQPTRSTMVIY
jgi:Ca-activated chloride channel family protein